MVKKFTKKMFEVHQEDRQGHLNFDGTTEYGFSLKVSVSYIIRNKKIKTLLRGKHYSVVLYIKLIDTVSGVQILESKSVDKYLFDVISDLTAEAFVLGYNIEWILDNKIFRNHVVIPILECRRFNLMCKKLDKEEEDLPDLLQDIKINITYTPFENGLPD